MIDKKIIKVLRIRSVKDINLVFKNKDIYKFVCDDYTKNPDEFNPESIIDDDRHYFIGAYCDDVIAGMFYYHPHNRICYEVHSAVLPKYRGKLSVEMAKLSLSWIFNNTDCKKVIGNIPKGYFAALVLAKKAGMTVEGVNRMSFMKNNKLLDQTILGITSEEASWQ